jgi:DNA-binding XRE family transcriptional regulator
MSPMETIGTAVCAACGTKRRKSKLTRGRGGEWFCFSAWDCNRRRKQPNGIESFYLRFGERIRQCRESAGMTQEQLATAMGLSRPSIANVEAGRQRVLLHQLSGLAKAMRLAPAALVQPFGKGRK